MFGWLRKTNQQPQLLLRDTLFGDLPLDRWIPSTGSRAGEPWASFAHARDAIRAGRRDDAVEKLKSVLAQGGLESRHHLEAWEALRALGVKPSEAEAKHSLGVVVEVPISQGFDFLAAYADHSARYYNHAGGGVVWDRIDDRLDSAIDAVLSAAHQIATRIGPWTGPRPPGPPPGHARLSILTPSGLHFGQGPFETFAADPMAAPLFTAATILMQQITAIPRAKA